MRRAIFVLFAIAGFLMQGPAFGQSAAPAAPRAARPRAQGVGPYQRSAVDRLLRGGGAPVDSLNVIVFMVEFADSGFAADHDAAYFENELRHLGEYFLGASRNIFHLSAALHPSAVALSKPEAHYGDDDLWKERMAEILVEVVAQTDATVDFSRYDAFAIIHADPGQETDFNEDSDFQIASGFVNPREMEEALEGTLGTQGVPTNDLVNGEPFQIDNLMVWPEESSQDGYTFGSLGLRAYQVGLRLGMLPLYDTTPDPYPDSQGIGNFDLMSYGIYNALGFVPAFPSAFNRYLMGWLEPVVVDTDGAFRLVDVSTGGSADTTLLRIPINVSEYYLVENRVHDTNFNGRFDFIDMNGNGVPDNPDTLRGMEFDYFLTSSTNLAAGPDSVITGSGVMIYHVDEAALRRALDSGSYPNDDRDWKGVDLEEADHVQDLDRPTGSFAYGSFHDSFRKGNNERFAPDTNPASDDNAGAPTGIELSGISEAGHYMTFDAHFAPPLDFVRIELAGDASKLSPIPLDIDGDAWEDLVVAADTGLIHLVYGAGSSGWADAESFAIRVDGALWEGPPVAGEVSDIASTGIFAVSRGGTLYGFDHRGLPLTIDDDDTPGAIQLRGDRRSGIGLERFTWNPWGHQLAAFSSTEDSTYLYLLGFASTRPDPWWRTRGILGMEFGLVDGRLASFPVLSEHAGGAFLATYLAGQGLRFHYVPLYFDYAVEDKPQPVLLGVVSVEREPADLLVPASGDIDCDRLDELVAVVPGKGLYYFKEGGAPHFTALRGSNPTPAVLSDIDGDGTLDTALRDDEYLYLFSGYGTPARGWPVKLDDASAARDRTVRQAPPVIADVNGDGKHEIVFRVSGDLRAYDFSGRLIAGWPLAGEGVAGGAVTALRGEESRTYLVDCASSGGIDLVGGEAAFENPVVSLRRYSLGTPYLSDQSWPCFRRNAMGRGAQGRSCVSSSRDRVDPATFIMYPNPAEGPQVTARVLVSAPARVTVTIFNIEGEKVVERTLDHTWFSGSAVPFETSFSTASFSGGVYICRIEVAGDGWEWTGAKKFAVIR